MDETTILDYITTNYPGVEMISAYGYQMFFYGSDRKLSFATVISSDTEYDHISNLDRPGVYRLNIGISRESFQAMFPSAETEAYDYTALDTIMPHPEYAKQHYVCVLSPSETTFEKVRGLLTEAYERAARRTARSDA